MSWEIAAEVGYEIIKVAERKGLLKKLKDAFRKKHRILLLGSSGTGKTQFLDSFGNIFAEALDHVARTEFPVKRRIDIEGRLFEFIDTPGQILHKSRRIHAIRDCLSTGISGVLNIAAFGYHEYGTDTKEVLTNGYINPKYQTKHLELEIQLINEWAPLLKDEWIITVISKADLWWDNHNQVIDHYSKGDYSVALNSANQQSAKIVRPFCSTMSKFYNALSCSGNFDDTQRRKYRNSLFATLIEAISMEKL